MVIYYTLIKWAFILLYLKSLVDNTSHSFKNFNSLSLLYLWIDRSSLLHEFKLLLLNRQAIVVASAIILSCFWPSRRNYLELRARLLGFLHLGAAIVIFNKPIPMGRYHTRVPDYVHESRSEVVRLIHPNTVWSHALDPVHQRWVPLVLSHLLICLGVILIGRMRQ